MLGINSHNFIGKNSETTGPIDKSKNAVKDENFLHVNVNPLIIVPKSFSEINFNNLIDVFLQVDRYENDKKISFPGKLTIEVAKGRGSFTNHPKSSIKVVNDFVIRAHRIKNRGLLKSSENAIGFKGRYFDNTCGKVTAKLDVTLNSDMIHNVRGKVFSEAGSIIWTSGAAAMLDNSRGILSADTRIVTATSTRKSKAKYVCEERKLLNTSGIITAKKSVLRLHLDKVDNAQGSLQGNELDLSAKTFSNTAGKLFIVQDGSIAIVDLFENDKGIVDIGGILTATNGTWSNREGGIRAAMGLDAHVEEFDNFGGLIFSPKGQVIVSSQQDIYQQGEVYGAEGIILLSELGTIWGQEGKIIAPQKNIVVESKTKHVTLLNATIQGGNLEVKSFQQLNLLLAKVEMDGKITFKTVQGWIDAQRTKMFALKDDISFEAPVGSLYLDDHYSKTGKNLSLHAKQVSVEKSLLDISGDLTFKGERFNAQKSTFKIEKGDVTLNGSRSLNVGMGKIVIPNGKIIESSDGWIIEYDEKSYSNEINRHSPEIFLNKVIDEAEKIACVAAYLVLNHYEGYANQSINFTADKCTFNGVGIDSPESKILALKLLIENMIARFDTMQIHTTHADIINMDAEGNKLFAKNKESLSIDRSKMIVKKIRLKTKENLSLTRNEVQGSVEASSDGSQHIVRNQIQEGDLKLLSRDGDISAFDNRFEEMGAIKISTPQGEAVIAQFIAVADSFATKGKELKIRGGKIHTKEEIDLNAQVSSIQQSSFQGNSTDITGSNRLDIENSFIKSDTSNFLKSENDTFLYKSRVEGESLLSVQSDQALLIESELISTKDSAIINATKNIVGISSLVAVKEDVNLSAKQSYWKESSIDSNTLEIDGSTYFDASRLQPENAVKFTGESVLLDNSDILSKGNILMQPHTIHLKESHILGYNIEQHASKEILILGGDISGKSLEQHSVEISSVNSHSSMQDKIHREAETISILKGSDRGFSIHEDGDVITHAIYKGVADTSIETASRDITFYESDLNAEDLKFESDEVKMYDSTFVGSVNTTAKDHLLAKNTLMTGKLANLSSTGDITTDRLLADVTDSIKINGVNVTLDKAQLKSDGTFQLGGTKLSGRNPTFISEAFASITSSSSVDFPGMQLYVNNSAQINAVNALNIPSSKLRINGLLNLSGVSIDRIASHVVAKSLSESVQKLLSARQSRTEVSTSISQRSSEGILDLQHSYTYAGSQISRQAFTCIDHSSANSIANYQDIDTPYFTNYMGNIEGQVMSIASIFDNSGGSLILDGGLSQFTGNHFLSNNNSQIVGSGSLKIVNEGQDFTQRGKVNLSGYDVTAGSVTMDGDIQSVMMNLNATHKEITVYQSLYSDFGTLTTLERISNYGTINFKKYGDLSCKSLNNQGKIHSHGFLGVDQIQNFVDPANVTADEHLLFSSNAPIILTQNRESEGSFTAISRNGFIRNNAPFHTKKNLKFEGSFIELKKPTLADGRGTFLSPGKMHVDHTILTCGDGIDGQVKTFHNDVGFVEVFGDSRLKCEDYLLSCEVIEPEAKKLGGFWGGHKTYIDKSKPYLYTPSTTLFHGDLELEVSNKAINDASTWMVDGKLFYKGNNFENLNRTHIHDYQVETGSYQSSCLGINYGPKKKTYAWKHDTIIDGVANTQVGDVIHFDLSGKVTNDGIIYGKKIQGTIGSLQNGVFNSSGHTPSHYSQSLRTVVPGKVFRPGGEVSSTESMSLIVNELLHNRGFIESDGGPLRIRAAEILNETRVTEASEQIVKTGTLGKRTAHYVPTDNLEPGGKIHGGPLSYVEATGLLTNIGGSIVGKDLKVLAKEMLQKPLMLRKVDHFKSSNITPWQTASGYSNRNDIISSDITSGGKGLVIVEDHLENIASDITAFNGLKVIAGSLKTRTIFDVRQSHETRVWKKSENIFTQIMRESRIRSVTGNLDIFSTKGDIDLEGGDYGSFGGGVNIVSAGDILFKARTQSVENEISRVDFTPTSFTATNIQYNSTLTSMPRVFAGGGSIYMKAHRNILGEGVQFTAAESIYGNAKLIHFKDHLIDKHHWTDGFSVGLKFFGSDAINSAASGKPLHTTVEALLREDPAISSAYDLAASKGNMQIASNALKTAVHSWNETAKFSKAYNDGRLQNSLGEHFGITNSDGEFQPQITARLGSFSGSMEQTSSLPTTFSLGKEIVMLADEQLYQGCEFNLPSWGEGQFIGDEVTFKAATERFESEGSSFGFSIGIGPQGPSVGIDYAENKSHGYQHKSVNHDFGKKLKIVAKEKMTLSGVSLDADYVDVDAKKSYIESLQDFFTHQSFSGSISSNGNFGYAQADGHSQQVNNVAGLNARESGTFTGDTLKLVGASLDKIEVKVKQLEHEDIVNSHSENSFSLQSNFKTIGKVIEGNGSKPEAFTLLGGVDFHSSRKNGRTVSTISGANGEDYVGINTDINAHQIIDHSKKVEISVPFIAINPEQMHKDAQQIKQAFSPTAAKPTVFPVLPKENFNKASNDVDLALMGMNIDLEEINTRKTAEENGAKEKKAAEKRANRLGVQQKNKVVTKQKHVNKVEETTKIISEEPSYSVESKSGALDVVISPHSNTNYNLLSEPLSESDRRKVETPTPWFSTIKEVFMDETNPWAFERDQQLNAMEINNLIRAILFVPITIIEGVTEVAVDSAHYVCRTHPKINKGCVSISEGTSRVYKNAKSKVIEWTPQRIKTDISGWLDNRPPLLAERVKYNQEYLGIPEVLTEDFHKTTLDNMLVLAPIPLGKGVSTVAKSFSKIKPAIKPVAKVNKPFTAFQNFSPHLDGKVTYSFRPTRNFKVETLGNDLDLSIKKIYSTIENHSSSPLKHLLDDASEMISKNIPSYGHSKNFLQNDVDIWLEAVQKNKKNLSGKTVAHYFGTPKGDIVALITKGDTSFVVKDSIYKERAVNEFVGIKFLQSLKLKHTQIPEPIGIGSHSSGSKSFVTKSFISGETIEELLIEAGATQQKTKRQLLVNQLSNVAIASGKALGELQNKGIKFSQNPSTLKVNIAIGNLHDSLALAQEHLSQVSKSLKISESNKFLSSTENFINNPGKTSFGFADIHGGQFVWDPTRKRPLGYIDAEFVPSTITKTHQPLSISAEEYSRFLLIFESEGFLAGLNSNEVATLKNSFAKGFSSEYTGLRSNAADHFFSISSSVTTIQDLAEFSLVLKNINKPGGNLRERFLRNLLEDLDHKLKFPPKG